MQLPLPSLLLPDSDILSPIDFLKRLKADEFQFVMRSGAE
jgi:hypothetical protein